MTDCIAYYIPRQDGRAPIRAEIAASLADAAHGIKLGAAVWAVVAAARKAGTRPDLRGADLRGVILMGADLTGAVLTGADLTRAVLRYAGRVPRASEHRPLMPAAQTRTDWRDKNDQ